MPRGGPSGGDGGAGGDVILVASEHHNTLLHFRFNPEHKAERGRHGEGSNRTGRDGRSVELPVPIGTMVYDADSGEQLFDFTSAGQTFVVARGGEVARAMPGLPRPPIRRPPNMRTASPAKNESLGLNSSCWRM